MTLRDYLKNGSTLLRVGMLFLILAMLSLRFLHSNAYLSENAADAVKGFLMGIAIACNLIAVRVIRRRGRAGRCV